MAQKQYTWSLTSAIIYSLWIPWHKLIATLTTQSLWLIKDNQSINQSINSFSYTAAENETNIWTIHSSTGYDRQNRWCDDQGLISTLVIMDNLHRYIYNLYLPWKYSWKIQWIYLQKCRTPNNKNTHIIKDIVVNCLKQKWQH